MGVQIFTRCRPNFFASTSWAAIGTELQFFWSLLDFNDYFKLFSCKLGRTLLPPKK